MGFGSDRYHREADVKSWARFEHFLQITTSL